MPAAPLSSETSWKIPVAFWLAALCWGTSFLWIKIGLENWNPVALVAFRLFVASLFFGLVLYFNRKPWKLFAPGAWILPIVAFLNPYVPFLLISWAEQTIDSGMASVLNGTVPLFTMLVAPLFLADERPTWRTFWGAVIGFAGILVLFGVPSTQMAGSLPGQLAVVLACFCYGLSTVLLRRFGPHNPPLVQAALINMLALAFIGIHAGATGALSLPPATMNALAVLWLGALGSFSAYSLAMYVMVRRGATYVSLTNFAYPLLGMVLGILFLGEAFHWRVLGGGILILGGIGLVQLQKIRKLRVCTRT
ncbi:DMT family transporter [bacterium]|nr:DMT family transporter [bacterium]